jgi:hypothetical protein
VAAAAETVPGDLHAGFDLVTVHLPWGSLLRVRDSSGTISSAVLLTAIVVIVFLMVVKPGG